MLGLMTNRLWQSDYNAFLELSEEEGFGLEDIKNIPSSDGQRAWYYPYKVDFLQKSKNDQRFVCFLSTLKSHVLLS
jgi:hypothetical protein